MYPAARVGDSVKHENWTDKKVEPPLVILTSVSVVLSGGTSATFLMAVGIAGMVGAGIDLAIKFVMNPTGEKIKTGATTVFTNLKAAALAHEKCKVDHGFVMTGAEHVFVEEGNASRYNDLTKCPGRISEGSKKPNQVLIGGKSDNHARPTLYTVFRAYQAIVSAGSFASSIRALSTQGFSLNEARKAATGAFGATSKSLEITTGNTALQTGKNILDRFMD
jgi:hypothetical protein